MSASNTQLLEAKGPFNVAMSKQRSHSSRELRRTHRSLTISIPSLKTASATNGKLASYAHSQSTTHHHRRSIPNLPLSPPSSSPSTSPTEIENYYVRPTGPELVSPKHPSCLGLPLTWGSVHDRFIAYLATHAPLDMYGKVQTKEEAKERWDLEDIARLVRERFGEELGIFIKVSMVEKRLKLLDLAGDNDYFKIPYGAYTYEEWGRGI